MNSSKTAHAIPTVELPELQLDIRGMTCAACANRIEKQLNRLDGVEASVNYATERAKITIDQYAALSLGATDLIEVVRKTGYDAELFTPMTQRADDHPGDHAAGESRAERELAGLRHRLIVTALLSIPVITISMV